MGRFSSFGKGSRSVRTGAWTRNHRAGSSVGAVAMARDGSQGRTGMSGVVLGVEPSLAVCPLLAFTVSLIALCEIGQGAGT